MPAWRRLGEAVQERRDALMLSQTELAAQAGISESTLRSIEAARRNGYRRGTLRALACALGWTPESIDAILAGGTPVVAEPAPEPPVHDELRILRERLDRLVELTGELARDRDELREEVEELKRRDPA